MFRKILKNIVFVLNLLIAFALLCSFFIPYISPEKNAFSAVISLTTPLLIILNFIFILFWAIKLDKRVFISALVLLLGYFLSTPFYNISNTKNYLNDDLSIMSYNVRLLNINKEIKKDSIAQKIISFVDNEKIDVIAFQEFHKNYVDRLNFKYHYFIPKNVNGKHGQAIFSNYEIINKGSLDFEKSANNAIFIDVLKNQDTVRIYNVHLQSLGIMLDKQNFGSKDSKSLISRLKHRFKKQASQVNVILNHQKKFKGKSIICGDFNNTAYSWVYRKLLTGKKDAFLKAGNGFGKTFNYYFPMRIDFILIDKSLTINWFKNYSLDLSDHEPILVRVN